MSGRDMEVPTQGLTADSPDVHMGRARFVGRAAAAFGAVAAAGSGAVAAFASADARRSISGRDRQVLEFALVLERLQNAFYSEALRGDRLTGEVRQFAEIVNREERRHLSYLVAELGPSAGKSATFVFGDATSSDARFVAAAVKLEETGLAAYNGQAENVSRETLAKVARVISVEARHAAWARGLAGLLPAPVAADMPISAATAMDEIRKYMG
jgi:rubrerythrin